MKLDLNELKNYPELLSKEQVRIVGHMSKRTALYLIQSKLLPAYCSGKATRCYFIKKQDLINFFEDWELNPHKYVAPEGWYKSTKKAKPLVLRVNPDEEIDEDALREFYTSKLRRMPQLLSVADVAGFTGYAPSTVTQWIRAEKLEAFDMLDRYLIPKPCLLDWISSSKYNHIERKSKKHLKALWTIAKM